MGKPTGFMEYERELPTKRDQWNDLKDWQEFEIPLAG